MYAGGSDDELPNRAHSRRRRFAAVQRIAQQTPVRILAAQQTSFNFRIQVAFRRWRSIGCAAKAAAEDATHSAFASSIKALICAYGQIGAPDITTPVNRFRGKQPVDRADVDAVPLHHLLP